jgi:hypothetical protein
MGCESQPPPQTDMPLPPKKRLNRHQRRAIWLAQALKHNAGEKSPPTKSDINMSTREQKKPFVIWLIVTMLINFVLMACAWIKTAQNQNDAAFHYIMVFLVVNIIAARIHGEMVRKFISKNKQ